MTYNPRLSDYAVRQVVVIQFAALLMAVLLQIAGGAILEKVFRGSSSKGVATSVANDFGVVPVFHAALEDGLRNRLKRLGGYTSCFAVITFLTIIFVLNHIAARHERMIR